MWGLLFLLTPRRDDDPGEGDLIRRAYCCFGTLVLSVIGLAILMRMLWQQFKVQ